MSEFLKKSVKVITLTGLAIIVFITINNLSMRRGKDLSTKEFVCDIREELIENPDFMKNRSTYLLKKCHDLITSNDWTFDKSNSEGDTFSYMPSESGRIHKITGIVNVNSAMIIDYMFDEIESSPEWNKQTDEAKRLCQIDEYSDIIYQSAKSFGNGLIGARDFLILRHRSKVESYNILTGVSVNLDKVPERKHFIRAENDITCFAARDLNDSSVDKCEFIWVVDIDLKGWIPQTIVDMTTSIGTAEYLRSLKHQVENMKN